jgi:dolichyl-phosphate-mannose--protein O-mannosyl transferase
MIFAILFVIALVDAADKPHVTCGSVIKMKHQDSSRRLHSHSVNYGSGSGQQSVTGLEGSDDSNSFWIVKGATNKPCPRGTPLKSGDIIRLEHMNTNKNLHSHHFQSPLSGKQEVKSTAQATL